MVIAAAGPSTVSRDAPARAAESAAVCAEVRAAQFSPTSTTSAASPSSSVRASTTVMATLPRSEPPRSRNISGPSSPIGSPAASSRQSTHNTQADPAEVVPVRGCLTQVSD